MHCERYSVVKHSIKDMIDPNKSGREMNFKNIKAPKSPVKNMASLNDFVIIEYIFIIF